MIVCDTSPLICLAALDKIELLDIFYPEWCVPEAVFHESTVDQMPFSSKLRTTLQDHLKIASGRDKVSLYEIYVDRGEAEVIALAEEVNAELILMDDKKGRRFAELKGFKVLGTVGLLIKAKQRGVLDELKPSLDRLMSSGIRISNQLFMEALKLAGER